MMNKNVVPEEQQKASSDSLALAANATNAPTIAAPQVLGAVEDSARAKGIFRQQESLNDQLYTLENDLFKLTFNNKGGRLQNATLKKYKTHDGKPVVLLDGEQNRFNYQFFTAGNLVETQHYWFSPIQSPQKLVFRLYADSVSYVEQSYAVKEGSYVIDYEFKLVGFEQKMAAQSPITLNWQTNLIGQEMTADNERYNTGIYFREKDESYDYLSETADDARKSEKGVEWVSFKQQFFNQTLIAKESFGTAQMSIKQPADLASSVLETASATINMEYNAASNFAVPMQLYVGPNHYQTLNRMGRELNRIIPLGWGIFGMVNKFIMIPLFNFFSKYISSYGLIIFLLTLVIKLVLFPLSYRSSMSMAKMNILKPEVEEIKQKYKDDSQRQQLEIMQLYGKAGASPLGGCIPQLIQLPILIGMYRFFPVSIELRQQPFLWAKDLSSYDSILNLPFTIPAYGNHVSLFCILSAVSTFAMTRMTSQMTPTTGGDNDNIMATQMKMMQWLMPFMLLFFFNSTASGLTYYFFLSNVISFVQQWVIKNYFIDEDKLHKQIQEKKNQAPKASSFQQRLEEMLQEQSRKQGKS